jgi:hypothetical protein
MSHVFSVFNIGTGHTAAEQNNTIADLYRLCSGANKFINDGPVGTMGVAQGKGMDPKSAAAVEKILAAKPAVVNLTGHSRGAVICHMIANDLAESEDPAAKQITQLNMILLDPVNQSVHTQRGKRLGAGIKLGQYVSIVMENVNNAGFFPTTSVRPMNAQFRSQMTFIHMPGSHGSGTQPFTSAIGKVCHGMIMRCMYEWGTRFRIMPPGAREMTEWFAQIRWDNPVEYDKKGLVKARLISDSDNKMYSGPDDPTLPKAWQGVGRVKQIAANYEKMGKANQDKKGINFRDSPLFFNEFNAACFKEAFPWLYRAFTGVPDLQKQIDPELDDIKKNLPYLWKAFKVLGMV